MKFETYHHQKTEEEIIAYWKKNKIVDKLREKNKAGKKFYFLDGPPYTSGKFHLAHAWNYALKDIVIRYHRSKGCNIWDRNGFDMHGLPTAHKVMAKHKLETKEDIEAFGVDKFINECIKFSSDMAKIMTEDLVRVGTTFDLSNPYMPIKNEFMEGEWQLIKTAYEKDRLYYGEKVLTWCQNCETALAKHECEYETVTDKSIFVKFKLNSKQGTNVKEDCADHEYVIIWTTTPWTIPYNLGVMANPKLDYVKVKVWDENKETGEKDNEEVWYLAKALYGVVCGVVAGKKLELLEEFKGDHMEGWAYTHPFSKFISKHEELKKDHPNVHTVILNEQYVDTTAGSGLVHTAPGCGPEDQEACKPYNIPPFNNLQENGYFPEDMGKFSGMRAKVDDPKFTEALKEEGALIKITDVEHEYPHCWRCHNPVVFRITYQWFFKIEDIKKRIVEENSEVNWVPDTALNSYESWVGNLKDNSISRQRFWGTPLPIWKCEKEECGEIKVIGSRKEIKDLGAEVPENLHRPWIDNVKFDCPKCKAKESMLRVPDIIDVWVDAGTASWNSLDNDPKLIEEWFPADAILEAKEQTRLWFSMLSICSYLRFDKKSFKNVYVYGMLNDIEGKKMSKSIGNIISPYELIDKHGVDVLRYYMCQNNAGQDINFSWDECRTKARQVQILWNLHKLLINLSKENNVNPFELDEKLMNNLMGLEENYIVSKLNSTIKKVDELFEKYELDSTILPLEELYLELSRTYVQLVREKSSIGSEEDKQVCVYTIAKVLLDFLKVFSIISPFITEAIYLNIKEEFGLKEESITHYPFPKFDEKKIDLALEENIEGFKKLSQAALNAREKAKLGVRWPVKELVIVSKRDEVIQSAEKLRDLLKKHVNAKEISLLESLPGVKVSVKPEASMIGKSFGKKSPIIMKVINSISAEDIVNGLGKDGYFNIEIEVEGKKEEIRLTQDMLVVEREVPELYIESETKGALVYLNTERSEELEAEGFAREVMRKVQTLRKNAGLQKTDSIVLHLKCSEDMMKSLGKFEKEIAEKIGAEKLVIALTNAAKKHQFKEDFKVKKEEFTAAFDKV